MLDVRGWSLVLVEDPARPGGCLLGPISWLPVFCLDRPSSCGRKPDWLSGISKTELEISPLETMRTPAGVRGSSPVFVWIFCLSGASDRNFVFPTLPLRNCTGGAVSASNTPSFAGTTGLPRLARMAGFENPNESTILLNRALASSTWAPVRFATNSHTAALETEKRGDC